MDLRPQISDSSVTPAVPSAAMTQAEFAKHRGVSEAMVSRWKAKGLLVFTAEGRVDVAASMDLLDRMLDPARGGNRAARPSAVSASRPPAAPAPPPAGTLPPAAWPQDGGDKANYNVEAARERRAKAQLAELELAEKAGTLVPAGDVEALFFDRVRAARDLFAQIGRRIAPDLALETDPAKIEAKLNAEYRAVCAALAAGDVRGEALAA